MENNGSIARERLALLFDDGSFTELDAQRTEREQPAAVVCAHGYVAGQPVFAFAQSPDVQSGVMGRNTAGKIKRLYGLAGKTGAPLVGIYDSNGVYVDGTAESLSAYGRLIAASANLSGVVPQISVICGVCAGSAALLAAEADFMLVSEKAELYLTPPFGSDAASPASAAKAGLAAAVCKDDAETMEKARALLSLLPANNLMGSPVTEYEEPAAPCTKSALFAGIADADSLLPLYTEFGDAAETALATVRGMTVGLLSTCRTKEAVTAADAAKMARFVRACDAFSIPVLTFVDTVGFDADNEAAKQGSLRAMAQLCGAYAEATTIKIAVIVGEACGAVFSAIAGRGAGSDLVLAWEKAAIAPMRPEAAVEFLWHDRLKGAENAGEKRKALAKEYVETLASAESAAKLGVVDNVIAEADTRRAVTDALDILEGKRVSGNPKKHSNLPF